MDLHQKVVSYIKKYYPDVMMNASLGENQDTSEKELHHIRQDIYAEYQI